MAVCCGCGTTIANACICLIIYRSAGKVSADQRLVLFFQSGDDAICLIHILIILVASANCLTITMIYCRLATL